MGKIVQIKKNRFDGGISDSSRKPSINEYIVAKHFDIFSDPYRLIPYRSLSADTNDGSTSTGMKQYFVKDFLYASTSARLYGLGQTSSGLTKIVYKNDATTGNWTLPTNSEGNGAVWNGCFVEYKNNLYGFQGTNQVFKWGTLDGIQSITNSQGTVGSTITSVAQGIIGKDDNLYLPYNNKLVRVTSGGTVNDPVLTLPTDIKITSLARFGNYLAVGCAPISTFNGKSVVFLWNYLVDDVQDTIDWGDGELRILENIEGMLVGITDRYLNNASGAGKGSMVLQIYQGGQPQVFKEYFTQALVGKTMPLSKAVKNNRLFFSAKIMSNSSATAYDEGIWSFGRKNAAYPWALSLDIIDENVNSNGIQAFGTAANYFFITHSADGSIDKTSSTATYSFTSIFEEQILDFGDVDNDKTLLSLKVYFRKLLTGETLTAKYKWDDASSFTTIGTYSTADKLSRTFLNIESTGASFGSGKELKLRLESSGGLEITGYKVEAQVNDVP